MARGDPIIGRPRISHPGRGTRLNLPDRITPGFYIEPGPDTPTSLVREIQAERAAVILPIPYSTSRHALRKILKDALVRWGLRAKEPTRPSQADLREEALQRVALRAQDRYGRNLRPGDRP